MTLTINETDKKRFLEIKKRLTEVGCRESNFVQVEHMFFEVLTISRNYGSDPDENVLLADLKRIQAGPYEKTQAHFRKSSQRESRIRQFIFQFKKAIS